MNDENLTPFPKGVSGNPKGKPKGAKSFSTRVKEMLSSMSDDNEWTSPLAAEKVKIIFAKDKKGNYISSDEQRQKAIDSILDRNEGKPVQTNINDTSVDIKNLPEVNINIKDDTTGN